MKLKGVARRRVLPTLAAAGALAATSCASENQPSWALDEIEIADGEVTEIDRFARLASVSPDAHLVAYVDDGELCVHVIGERRPDCLESPIGLDDRSFTWSEDGATLLMTHDLPRFLREPDVMALDIESLELEVLTDDGIDERPLDNDDSLLDQTPFVGPDDAVHFFRSEGDGTDFEMFRIDRDGRDADDAEQVGSMDLPRQMFPVGPVRRVDDDRWAVAGVVVARRTVVLVIDFDEETVTDLELDFENAALVDVAGGLALVADAEALVTLEQRFAIIDLETGRDRDVDLELDEGQTVTGAGFAPDGSSIAFVIGDRFENEIEVIAIPVDDGRADEDEAATLVRSRDFDRVLDDETFVGGFGAASEIVWSDDGTMVLATQDGVITFEITPA